MRTAQALGLTISSTSLHRVDKVIERITDFAAVHMEINPMYVRYRYDRVSHEGYFMNWDDPSDGRLLRLFNALRHHESIWMVPGTVDNDRIPYYGYFLAAPLAY